MITKGQLKMERQFVYKELVTVEHKLLFTWLKELLEKLYLGISFKTKSIVSESDSQNNLMWKYI